MEGFEIQREIEVELPAKSEKRARAPRARRKGDYKILSEDEKQKCLADAEQFGVKATAFKYGVDVQSVNRWAKLGTKRKRGCGRKVYNMNLEKELTQWCLDRLEANKIIRTKELKAKAVELSGDPKFRGSNGWLDKFRKRNSIPIGKFQRPSALKSS